MYYGIALMTPSLLHEGIHNVLIINSGGALLISAINMTK